MDSTSWRHFDDFSINLATGELRRCGVPIAIERQPALVLARLVAEPGMLVPRQVLRRAVWPDDTFVDFDRGLNYCIRQARLALGDDGRTPRYIETVPRQGYRFVAAVNCTHPARPASRGWRVVAALAAAALLTLVAENGPGSESHHQIAVGLARTAHDWLF